MALSSTATWQNHTVSSPTADSFATDFPFVASSDIVVKNLTQRVTLSEGSDYAVTGGGAVAGGGYTTGTIDLDSGTNMAADDWLYIERVTALTQSTDLTAHDNLPSSTIENALDRAMMISQEAERDARKWNETLYVGDAATDLAVTVGATFWKNRLANTVHVHDITLALYVAPSVSTIIVSVRKALTDIYATDIVIDNKLYDEGIHRFDTTVPVSLATNDALNFDIDQIGSGTAGSFLQVNLHLFDTGS